MGGFSLWHWLVVIILVMLLFGRGRISDMMGDIGKGLKSFKQGMADEDNPAARRADERPAEPRPLPRDEPIDLKPEPRQTAEPAPPPSAGDTPPRP